MDLFFCPFRPSRSKRSTHSHQPKTNANNPSSTSKNYNSSQSCIETSQPTTRQENHGQATQQQQATIPYRYVIKDFEAKAADEISVFAGDAVFYEFTDNGPDGSWAHVFCTRTYKRGFVPSHILSRDPKRAALCKKKIPRSSNEASRVSNTAQTHHNACTIGQLSSNSDNVHFQLHRHAIDFTPRFSVSHSLQSSSGNHSFHRYPDLRQLCPPSYYNVRDSKPHYDCCDEIDFRPFNRENLGLYVVIHNFVAREENDLNVGPGDCLTLLNRDDEDWYWVRRGVDGEEGFVPSKFICDYDHVKSFIDKGNSTATLKSLNQNDFHTYINHRPDRESVPTDQQSSVFQ